MAVKYLDLAGLQINNDKIKELISTGDAKAYQSANFDTSTRILSLYKADSTEGVADFTVEIPETDVSGLLEKIVDGTVGNIVTVGADGTVIDSGIALADLATKEEVETVSDKVEAMENAETGFLAQAKDYADSKDEAIEAAQKAGDDAQAAVDALAEGAVADNTSAIEVLNGDEATEGSVKKAVKDSADAINAVIGTVDEGKTVVGMIEDVIANGYDDEEVRELIQANTDAIEELGTDKADKATTLEGYGITDAYTKGEVDTAITTAVANAEHLKRSIVDVLPDVAESDAHTIYMVAIVSGDGNQKYEEFMLINDAFEKIGDSAVDLTDYATDSDVSTAKTEAVDEAKAYADGLALNYDAAGSATAAQTNAQTYADGLNTAMGERVDAIEASVPEIEAISEEEINSLFE